MIDAYVTWMHHLDHAAPVLRLVPHRLFVGHSRPMIGYARALGLEPIAGRGPATHPTLIVSGNELPGFDNVIFLEHGVGQTYEGLDHVCWPGGPDRGAVGLFLCPNAWVAEENLDRYPNAAYAIVGSPHVEYLRTLPLEEERDVVGIATHWESGPVPELRSAWSWYEAAYALLAADRPVVLHAHPRHQDWVRHCAREWGVPFAETFDALCRWTNLLVTDNSSALYEYAALDRPVVSVNPPWYRRDVDHGLRFWEYADVGEQVFEPMNLANGIRAAYEYGPPLRAREISRVLFGDDLSEGAAKRAAEAIGTYVG